MGKKLKMKYLKNKRVPLFSYRKYLENFVTVDDLEMVHSRPVFVRR